MTIRNLEALFHPRSIAVVGASARPGSLGTTVMRNLLDLQFHGPVLPINPKYQSVMGVLCYPSAAAMPIGADLAVLCTPPGSIAGLIGEFGARGTRAVIIMTVPPAGETAEFYRLILEAARPFEMRILGPDSTGVQIQAIGLHASWVTAAALPGKVAFISQSGSLIAWMLERACEHGVGFSHVISAGEAVDVDIADLLDYLGTNTRARAVLLYIRSVNNARKFLSAARAIARIKPLIVIKAERRGDDKTAADNDECFVPISSDAVYDAAFRRAGMLRVRDTDELFDAVETLSFGKTLRGERLAILCNGAGPAQMAVDALIEGGGRLAEPSEDCRRRIAELAGDRQPVGLPFDLGRDADAARYGQAIRLLLADPTVDALLVMHIPTAAAGTKEVADVVQDAARRTTANILACLLGRTGASELRAALAGAGVPLYETPEKAARAFLHLVHYRRNQDSLLQVPATLPAETGGGRQHAHTLVRQVQAAGRRLLNEEESAAVLAGYGFSVFATRMAADGDAAAALASAIGFPVSLRLASRRVRSRHETGPATADLVSADAVRIAAADICQRFAEVCPGQDFPGLVVQAMTRRPGAALLSMGVSDEPVFGRVIFVGRRATPGASCSEQMVALPPLNLALAEEMLARCRAARLLPPAPADGGDGMPAALVALSELVVDMPEVAGLDIAPALIDGGNLRPLDVRIGLGSGQDDGRYLAIRPYPRELERTALIRDGRLLRLRPIRPQDGQAYRALLANMSPRDLYLRFCSRFGDHAGEGVPSAMLAKLIHIDYDREMTFVASLPDEGDEAICGVVEITTSGNRQEAEYSILVRSDMQGVGLGRLLMETMVAYCRHRHLRIVYGLVLKENEGMLGLAHKIGFIEYEYEDETEDDMVKVVLAL